MTDSLKVRKFNDLFSRIKSLITMTSWKVWDLLIFLSKWIKCIPHGVKLLVVSACISVPFQSKNGMVYPFKHVDERSSPFWSFWSFRLYRYTSETMKIVVLDIIVKNENVEGLGSKTNYSTEKLLLIISWYEKNNGLKLISWTSWTQWFLAISY